MLDGSGWAAHSTAHMTDEDFARLTPLQQNTMVLAIAIRNAMEDFHVRHLTDQQMEELNPIIRQALFDVLYKIQDPDRERQHAAMRHLVEQIPGYWEVPFFTSGFDTEYDGYLEHTEEAV